MKKIPTLLFLSATLLSNRAFAGIGVSVNIGFPAPPPLVVVAPGVQIVEDNDDEIFFNDGYYWVERDGGWYRTKDYHGHWVVVEREHVPVFIAEHHPGAYKHWKHEEHQEHEEHEERKAEKHESHEEKHEEHGKKHGKH